MRIPALVFLALALDTSAVAEPEPDYVAIFQRYEAELQRQCADKRLDWIAPGTLQGVLEEFRDAQTSASRALMNETRLKNCFEPQWGATCYNNADIIAADQLGLTRKLATKVCRSIKRCVAQSDCEIAS